MKAVESFHPTGGAAEELSMLILHEDYEALTRATKLCDRLVQRFISELSISMNHWPFEALEQEPTAAEAAEEAVGADIIVVAASSRGDFEDSFSLWMERWLARRGGREGALVGLFTPSRDEEGRSCAKEIHLHRTALRAGMDYLNHLPERPPTKIPDAVNWCQSRAEARTDTLEGIVQKLPKPRW